MNIKLNIEELKNASKELKTKANDLNDTIASVDKIIKELPQNWEGKTANAYQEQYTTYRKNLINSKTFIEDIATQIDAVLTNSEGLDQDMSEKLK